jgi:hypothetical protein
LGSRRNRFVKLLTESTQPRSWPARIAAGIAVLVFCALLFEISVQLYAVGVVNPRNERMRRSWKHFYRASDNPILVYEPLPGTEVEVDGRRLRINRWGIRDDHDAIPRENRRIAILGDSVVFGMAHSQERTISQLLERELERSGDRVRVLNFGLSGYSLRELVEFLRIKDAVYDVDAVIYLLNPNDFARRDSVYEGADDGLYRMYRTPWLKSPWFLRKAIYRFHKAGHLTLRFPPRGQASVGWYAWLFGGNEQIG